MSDDRPKEYGGTPPPNYDIFYDFILIDELARCGNGGLIWAVFMSAGVALPPILDKSCSKELRDKVARPVIEGTAIMSLAISEPQAGSDVADLHTTAVKDGDHYILNGTKKWITSGTKAKYFTVVARTGTGMGGLTLFLVDRDMKGVSTRRMKTMGMYISSTAFVDLDDVRVPTSNMIGLENAGFKSIMHNFNHERLMMAVMCNRFSRICLAEGIKYARERKTFGVPLISQQVIRHKCAEMARQIEATHALLESIFYQIKMGANDKEIGGPVAMVKVQCTKVFEFCARESSQIFGGHSFVRGGRAGIVERLYRDVRFNAIAGGSEEIMLDLVCKQAKL